MNSLTTLRVQWDGKSSELRIYIKPFCANILFKFFQWLFKALHFQIKGVHYYFFGRFGYSVRSKEISKVPLIKVSVTLCKTLNDALKMSCLCKKNLKNNGIYYSSFLCTRIRIHLIERQFFNQHQLTSSWPISLVVHLKK